MDLVTELRSLEARDVKEPLFPLTRSILKSSAGLYYRPRPYFFGEGSERRVYDHGGEFLPETNYSRKGMDEFLQRLVVVSTAFRKAEECFGNQLGGSADDGYAAELYLLMFCYHLLTSEEKTPIDSILDGFLDSLSKREFKLQFRIGIDGISIVEKELALSLTQNERVIIRQAGLDDLSIPVLVKEPWKAGTELEGIYAPSFPPLSSVIVLEIKNPTFTPIDLGWLEIRFRSAIRTLDWLLDAIRIRINEMNAIFTTFQSKTAPRYPYIGFQFYAGGFSVNQPIYERRLTWQSSSNLTSSFELTASNQSTFQTFWKTMTERRILDKIYGRSTSPWEQTSSPTKEAFIQYHDILTSKLDVGEATRNAVIALESLYAYKKGSKLFIQLFQELLKLTGIRDPNNTKECLDRAWRIRSEQVHRGSGWDPRPNINLDSDSPGERDRQDEVAINQYREGQISHLVLNYLRISLVARIIANCDDTQFLSYMQTTDGRTWLASELKQLSELVSGDPLPDLLLEPETRGLRVFVDAKIVGRHDPSLPKRTFVAYLVDDSPSSQGVKEVVAPETDDAELHAVAFALDQLKDKFERFTIICDHESAVSIINRREPRLAEKRPILQSIIEVLKSHPSIQVVQLTKNPAHSLLNAYLAKVQGGPSE